MSTLHLLSLEIPLFLSPAVGKRRLEWYLAVLPPAAHVCAWHVCMSFIHAFSTEACWWQGNPLQPMVTIQVEPGISRNQVSLSPISYVSGLHRTISQSPFIVRSQPPFPGDSL